MGSGRLGREATFGRSGLAVHSVIVSYEPPAILAQAVVGVGMLRKAASTADASQVDVGAWPPGEIDGGAASATQSDGAKVAAVTPLLPDEGYLHLDRLPTGRFLATHELTLERRHLLEHKEWRMLFDEGGFATFVEQVSVVDDASPADDIEQECLFADEFMEYSLYKAPNGDILVTTSAPGLEQQVVNLREFRDKYVLSDVSLPIGVCKARRTLHVAGFRRTRNRAKLFVSMKGIDEVLGLSQFNGNSWRWILAGRGPWLKVLCKVGCSDHFATSTQCGKHTHQVRRAMPPEGCCHSTP